MLFRLNKHGKSLETFKSLETRKVVKLIKLRKILKVAPTRALPDPLRRIFQGAGVRSSTGPPPTSASGAPNYSYQYAPPFVPPLPGFTGAPASTQLGQLQGTFLPATSRGRWVGAILLTFTSFDTFMSFGTFVSFEI